MHHLMNCHQVQLCGNKKRSLTSTVRVAAAAVLQSLRELPCTTSGLSVEGPVPRLAVGAHGGVGPRPHRRHSPPGRHVWPPVHREPRVCPAPTAALPFGAGPLTRVGMRTHVANLRDISSPLSSDPSVKLCSPHRLPTWSSTIGSVLSGPSV